MANHKDLLNDTLKLVGLETLMPFKIDDPEFGDIVFHVDSFGDVYLLYDNGEENELAETEDLTLGRILTQYPDKIVPMQGGRI